MNSDEYENPYWDHFLSLDLGSYWLRDLDLGKEIDSFLDTQSYEGTIYDRIWDEAQLLLQIRYPVVRYCQDGLPKRWHVQKYATAYALLQRLDGGWYCNPNIYWCSVAA
jgi:hypothetical protein